MRYLVIGTIIFLFGATPVYLFDTLVMPELESLQHTYSHAGEIADRIATGN